MKATNQSVQRSFNRSLVLQAVRDAGRISRVGLARQLGLEKSSVSAIVGELIGQGVLHETARGEASQAGGRKPVFLALRGDFCCFLGLELQPGHYRAVVLDLAGQVRSEAFGRFSQPNLGFDGKLARAYRELDPAVRGLGLPLAGLCLGLPGLVNPRSALVGSSIPHSLQDWDLARAPNPWNVPAYLENDANCCAWATLLQGDPTGGGDFLAVLIGLPEIPGEGPARSAVSIGLGLVLGGALHYGRNYDAGEFTSLAWRSGRLSQTGMADEELAAMLAEPELLDRFLTEFLSNLIPVCTVLAPQKVIFCGEGGRFFARIPDLLAGPLAGSWLALPEQAGRLVRSPYGPEIVALGAAGRLVWTLFNRRSLSRSAQGREPDWDDLLARFGHQSRNGPGAAPPALAPRRESH